MEFLKNLKTNLVTMNPVTLVLILLIIVPVLLLLTFLPQKKQSPNITSVTPSPRNANTPTPFVPAKYIYPKDKVEKLLSMVDQRTALSSTDLAIRNRLVSSLGSTSGILYQSTEFTIEYVKSPDVFMVAIKNILTDQANKNATQWFKELGISDAGICHFPIVFYPAIASDQLPPGPVTFNPLPSGC